MSRLMFILAGEVRVEKYSSLGNMVARVPVFIKPSN
jgi:hypothetical protein